MIKDGKLAEVLLWAYCSPFKIQSDYARAHAQEVACLACLGMLSTQDGPSQYGRKWRITGIGLEELRKLGIL